MKAKRTTFAGPKSAEEMISARRSFTLVEVLLAMLITTILVLGVNAAFKQAHLIWSHAEDRRPAYQDTRILTELLRTELTGLYLPPKSDDNAEPFELSSSKVEFYTLTPAAKGSVVSSRIAKVRYEFASNGLRRSEQPYAGEKKIGKDVSDVVIRGLSKFSLSAFDRKDKQWKDTYKSKDAPPGALRVSLGWPAIKNVPPMNFETTFFIPCQTVLVR